MPDIKYRTGRPSFFDRFFRGAPDYYAYSRHTREPVVFHEGPVNWKGDLGQHSDFPGLGGIDVDVTRGDPQETLMHEQMHHAFPWWMGEDRQHGSIEALRSEDPLVRAVGLQTLPEELTEEDRALLKKLMRK